MTPNHLFSIGLYTVLSIGATIAFCGWLQVRSFLASYSSIDSQRDIDEFKCVVKTNMYLALLILATAVVAIGLVASGIALGSLGWADLRLVLFIMGPVCVGSGAILTAAEWRMKAIPLTDASLRSEFDSVVKRWASSALPDW